MNLALHTLGIRLMHTLPRRAGTLLAFSLLGSWFGEPATKLLYFFWQDHHEKFLGWVCWHNRSIIGPALLAFVGQMIIGFAWILTLLHFDIDRHAIFLSFWRSRNALRKIRASHDCITGQCTNGTEGRRLFVHSTSKTDDSQSSSVSLHISGGSSSQQFHTYNGSAALH